MFEKKKKFTGGAINVLAKIRKKEENDSAVKMAEAMALLKKREEEVEKLRLKIEKLKKEHEECEKKFKKQFFCSTRAQLLVQMKNLCDVYETAIFKELEKMETLQKMLEDAKAEVERARANLMMKRALRKSIEIFIDRKLKEHLREEEKKEEKEK